MATKKQKRIAGELKAAQQREESRASGLKAQREDQIYREEQYQRALIARDKIDRKYGAVLPTSKISQEKADRVAKRLAEKNSNELKRDVLVIAAASAGFHDDALDLSSVDC